MRRQVLDVQDVEIIYRTRGGPVRAVSGLSFSVFDNEVFGLVGESGSGKSTLAMAILGNLPDTGALSRGRILFDGRDLATASPTTWRAVRWKHLAYVPQGAMNVLNPLRRIRDQFDDIITDHGVRSNQPDWQATILALLKAVHLMPSVLACYPHELSGGMKQRVCIAMAMLLGPKLIIADESTSALDVISQRVVLQTLLEVRARLNAAIVLIGHDLALQAQVADRVGIMLAGRFVEIGPVTRIFDHPLHPYTQRLIASVPSIRHQHGLPDIGAVNEEERKTWLSDDAQLIEVEPGHFVASASERPSPSPSVLQ
jgi:peptide/nickel transport system ATP-binding protein